MSDNTKKYSERPKSYHLLANNKKEMDEALKELLKDHPELYRKNENGEKYYAMIKNKYGFYVLK